MTSTSQGYEVKGQGLYYEKARVQRSRVRGEGSKVTDSTKSQIHAKTDKTDMKIFCFTLLAIA